MEGADYTLTIRMTRPPSRILLLKPSALGDVCRTMPVLASLRAAFPDARIDWFVQDDFVDAVRAHPAVGEVIAFPRRAWRRWWGPAAIAGVRGLRRRIRETGYDLAFDLQGLVRSAVFLQATGRDTRRVGWRDARECAWLAANERHARRGGPDATETMLALLEDAGVPPIREPRMFVPPEAAAAWSARRNAAGLDGEFVARGARVAMLGAPSEREQVRTCMPREGAVDLCGALPLGEWLAALSTASAVVANDSAATHAAVGFGRPLVAIYGATDPAAVGPFGRPESVVAPPGVAPSDPHAYRDPRLVQRMELVGVDAVARRLDEERARGPRW